MPSLINMVIKVVLFDFGGTLVRHSKLWQEAKPEAVMSSYNTLKRRGLKLQYKEYKEFSESIFQGCKKLELEENRDILDFVVYQEIVRGLFPSHSEAWHRRVAAQANDAYWAVIDRNYALSHHARPALAKLKAMKLPMAIISNHSNPKALVAVLRRFRIAPFFSRIFVSSDVGMRKPDPRFFEACLSSIRTRPANAIFVGNSPKHDVAGAKSAGMRAILLVSEASLDQQDRESVEPDFVVRDLLEVPGIVSSLA